VCCIVHDEKNNKAVTMRLAETILIKVIVFIIVLEKQQLIRMSIFKC